jgi:CYTH domain-containing protein
MGVEIERKFLVEKLPENLESYDRHVIEQGYLNVSPAVRVRREDDIFYMTYKGKRSPESGGIGQVEYNMPLDEESYLNLIDKADGNIIRKTRYLLPLNNDAFTDEFLKNSSETALNLKNGNIKIELDVFEGIFSGLYIAEVEFQSEEAAENYKKASWFCREVTGDIKYSNAYMSAHTRP